MADSNSVNKPVGDMALYNLDRAKRSLDALARKPTWSLSDTADFDCMHYQGDAALEKACKWLDLRPGQTVLDIGSGFSATGRYMNKHYGVDVTGIELQPEIHEIAEIITQRNGLSRGVRSINADFTKFTVDAPVDCIVSFLCILHIPDRNALFQKVMSALKPGGKLYIEDFYALSVFSKDANSQLRDILLCPYLPSSIRYLGDLSKVGFYSLQYQDISEEWTQFVHDRAIKNREKGTSDASLTLFYDTVDALFTGGDLGGIRIMATKARPMRPQDFYH